MFGFRPKISDLLLEIFFSEPPRIIAFCSIYINTSILEFQQVVFCISVSELPASPIRNLNFFLLLYVVTSCQRFSAELLVFF